MASPAEIARVLPETLPDDFVEWDSGDSSAKRSVEPARRDAARDAAHEFDAPVRQPARPEDPIAHAPARVDESQNALAPSATASSPDQEALRRGLRAIATAADKKPVSAAQLPPNAHASREIFFAPARPKTISTGSLWNAPFQAAPKVEGPYSIPVSTPPSGCADDEAFLGQLKAIGTVLNTQPISTSQKRVPARATNEVSPPQSQSTAQSQSKEAASRRWPVRPIEVTATVGPANLAASSNFEFGFVKAEAAHENSQRKKFMKLTAIAAAVVLLVFLGFRLMNPGKPTLAKQSVDVRSADVEAASNQPETSTTAETGASRPPAVTRTQQPTNLSTTAKPALGRTPAVDSQLMNDQLTAAPLIPQDIKTKPKEDPPPPPTFAAANVDDLGNTGAIGSMLGDQTRPAVHYAPDAPTILAAAAAEKLLIERKSPVYPPKAWKYYISGKVALEAIVSKTGSVKTLKVLSGKPEFEQAALEAVRTWRYKPYLMNGQPVEFQTTINVTFDANK